MDGVQAQMQAAVPSTAHTVAATSTAAASSPECIALSMAPAVPQGCHCTDANTVAVLLQPRGDEIKSIKAWIGIGLGMWRVLAGFVLRLGTTSENSPDNSFSATSLEVFEFYLILV